MFVVNQELNKIMKIKNKTFQALGIREREHLQEWIADNTECLGEELLIIQKEFDGFDETNERLDLLALDKNGDLVIIENKLDDSGRDVTWQALKYVSYCHTLTKQQIKEIYQSYLDKISINENAEENIEEFFNGEPFQEISLNENDQRMILIAGKFRKEVTSTVLWLIEHGIKIQCFKVSPYEFDSNILLDIEQIIPVKETQELMIKMTDKKRQVMEIKEQNHKRYEIRREFWGQLLEKFNTMSEQYKNVNPSKDHWLSSGSGVSGVPFSFVITKTYAAVEVSINIGEKERNKKIFDILHQSRVDIETDIGTQLFWQRLDEKKSSRISLRLNDVNYFNQDEWERIIEFLCHAMLKFIKGIKEPLKQAASVAR